MNTKMIALVAGLALGVSFIGTQAFSRSTASSDAQSAAAATVLESGTIRAGYIVYPPYIVKDPKTGQLSGVFYDLTNALGDQLGLKIQWVEGSGYGTIFTDLDSGRYDVFAGGLWANSTRAKAGLLTTPVFYSAIYAYARSSDHRFDNNLATINTPDTRISTMDGAIDNVIANTDYPKAQDITLPQSAVAEQAQLDVISGKADVTFAQSDVILLFLKTNPGTLRQIATQPLRIFGNSYAVKRGANDLLQMLNVATQEAVNNGTVEKIIEKYQLSPNSYLQLAPSYAK